MNENRQYLAHTLKMDGPYYEFFGNFTTKIYFPKF